MEEDSLFNFYIENIEDSFMGWDFSEITDTDRIKSSPLSWSYFSEVSKYIYKNDVNTMLDMGTGGGEFLSKIIELPPNTYASEGYEPNIPIARKRLNPLGVEVVKVENDVLKFDNNYFDLVINRHESYSVEEVKRVIKNDGFFITQQVGSENCSGINRALGVKEDMGLGTWNLDFAKQQLKKNRFKLIKSFEEFPKLRFYDIGALIYYLKAVPWQVDSFSVESFKTKLKEIHDLIQSNNYFEVSEHRFFIIAEK